MPTRTSGPVNVLVAYLVSRYKQTGGIRDVNEAPDALSLCPPGHLDRSMLLNNLAAYLISRYNKNGVCGGHQMLSHYTHRDIQPG